jgi:anionic cell wall polymer biosynthesis LytR-Cps2A-Psr (LCP) family protein
VNRYAVVNFEAFANLVDAVGGVDMELTNEEVGWVNAYLNEYNELRGMPLETDYLDTSLSGNIHLNGAQALAYCRNRYIGTDFGRTQRQRKVLTAVLQKLPLAAVTNPAEIVNGLFGNLTTNLTQVECTQLALSAGKLLTYEMVQDSLPLEGTYSNATIREMSVLQVDFEQNKAYIRKEIYGEE